MATDWIKMRVDLQTHPKVVRIASALRADRLRAVGGLHAVWSLFDAHSVDGTLEGYTADALDSLIGWPGFTQALAAVGWIEVSEDSLALPRFDEHNGKSAKRRATETERKRRERSEDGPQDVRDPSASDADKRRTESGPEKRREEKKEKNPPTPRGGAGQRFEDFWLTWPKNERKQDKAKCLDHWRRHDLDAIADTVIADVKTKRGTQKWADGFVEAPLVYLRGKRWEDGVEPMPRGAEGQAVADWRESKSGIVAKGIEIGLGPWDEEAHQLDGYSQETGFLAYKARVFAKVRELEDGPIDRAGLARLGGMLATIGKGASDAARD